MALSLTDVLEQYQQMKSDEYVKLRTLFNDNVIEIKKGCLMNDSDINDKCLMLISEFYDTYRERELSVDYDIISILKHYLNGHRDDSIYNAFVCIDAIMNMECNIAQLIMKSDIMSSIVKHLSNSDTDIQRMASRCVEAVCYCSSENEHAGAFNKIIAQEMIKSDVIPVLIENTVHSQHNIQEMSLTCLRLIVTSKHNTKHRDMLLKNDVLSNKYLLSLCKATTAHSILSEVAVLVSAICDIYYGSFPTKAYLKQIAKALSVMLMYDDDDFVINHACYGYASLLMSSMHNDMHIILHGGFKPKTLLKQFKQKINNDQILFAAAIRTWSNELERNVPIAIIQLIKNYFYNVFSKRKIEKNQKLKEMESMSFVIIDRFMLYLLTCAHFRILINCLQCINNVLCRKSALIVNNKKYHKLLDRLYVLLHHDRADIVYYSCAIILNVMEVAFRIEDIIECKLIIALIYVFNNSIDSRVMMEALEAVLVAFTHGNYDHRRYIIDNGIISPFFSCLSKICSKQILSLDFWNDIMDTIRHMLSVDDEFDTVKECIENELKYLQLNQDIKNVGNRDYIKNVMTLLVSS